MPKKPKKRGPKPSPDSARVVLGIKLSRVEKAKAEAKAMEAGTTASKWGRGVILRAIDENEP